MLHTTFCLFELQKTLYFGDVTWCTPGTGGILTVVHVLTATAATGIVQVENSMISSQSVWQHVELYESCLFTP